MRKTAKRSAIGKQNKKTRKIKNDSPTFTENDYMSGDGK